jgi:hypothetical protein
MILAQLAGKQSSAELYRVLSTLNFGCNKPYYTASPIDGLLPFPFS